MATIKMVRPPKNANDGGEDAFLRYIQQSGQHASIPPYLKVNSTGVENGREHFSILEGHLAGRHGSVTTQGGPYLVTPQGHQGGALVQFMPGKKKLRVANMPSLGEFAAIIQEERKLDAGLYELFIPDMAHGGGDGYKEAGAYRKVWFGMHAWSGPNFMHAGRFTLGCLAIMDLNRWPSLCGHLIRCRDGNRKIGTLNVCRPTAEDWCLFFNNRYRLASLGGETIVTVTCRKISDVCIAIEGVSPPPVNFRLSGVLPLREGDMCQTFIPETPGGGVMQGTWSERNGNHAQGHAGHVRLGTWTLGAPSPDIYAPVRIQWRGSVSRGYWGKPGTTKIEAAFDALEPRERPWYDFPWNPGYPWNAQPA